MSARRRAGLILAFMAVCGTGAVVQKLLEPGRNPGPPGELYATISQQIAAMREADYPRAYRQVSGEFQQRCNVEEFTRLVQADYPELLRASRVEFGRARFEGPYAALQVFFILPEGEVIPCVYRLIREDGAWKIDAAEIQKSWPAGRRLRGHRA